MSGIVAKGLYGHRVLRTARIGTAGYYAAVLLHRRLLCPSQPQTQLCKDAISGILDIAHTFHLEDPRTLMNIIWQLLMAGIETEDKIYRAWIRNRFNEMAILDVGCAWAGKMLEIFESSDPNEIQTPTRFIALLKARQRPL